MLKIYNSLSRSKQEFVPLRPGKVGIYVCGMTVYDYCHLGHARVLVVFDTIVRYLRESGYQVHYVRNITDIDDKIIARANENKESVSDLTERYIHFMNEDASALGVIPPDEEPRATASMADIITMVETLIEQGFAYCTDDGDVYYSVSKFADYGALSGKQLDDLRAGARVEVSAVKHDPLDFVLWKAAKQGEPEWDSPWGPGRPGWHIECSAMSVRCLGEHFDIHGGGQDLQFPHHENEIAQSQAATGKKFVNYWIHNGFIQVDEEKMSKSLGNFFTVREVLKHYRAEEVRYFILASHYRSPLNYSSANLDAAKAALTRLYTALRGVSGGEVDADRTYLQRYQSAMDDDFNTPEVFAVMFDLARALNRSREAENSDTARLASTLINIGNKLGLLLQDPDEFLRSSTISASCETTDEEVESFIKQREDARAARDWATADRIRERLLELGVVLEDEAGSTSWRRE